MKILIFLLLLLHVIISPVQARKQDGSCETESECQEDINKAQEMLTKLTKDKDTLSNQLKLIAADINLTQLKINQTENSVKILEKDIEVLSKKIGELDVYLNYLSKIFLEQISSNYKLIKRYPVFSGLFSNFNQLYQQYRYSKTLQLQSRDSLINLETARQNFDRQKEEKNRKQQELEALKVKLVSQNKDLQNQKSAKNNLLEVTKNDEKRYQKLKQDAESELTSLLKAKFVGKRQVKKGEAIGIMGNTGYSFGDHLHFGLYDLREEDVNKWTYVKDIDPFSYINEHMWPMKGYEITQGRGNTKYAYLYADRFHHGVDMVSDNKTIYAVNDGVAYFYRNPSSSLGNHVKLFHADGKMSLYLHMQ